MTAPSGVGGGRPLPSHSAIGAIVGLEHAYYVGTTGDLLFRFHALSAHNRTFAGAAQTGPPVAAATPVEGVIDHLTPGVTVTSGEGAQPPTDAVAVEDEVEADDDAPDPAAAAVSVEHSLPTRRK